MDIFIWGKQLLRSKVLGQRNLFWDHKLKCRYCYECYFFYRLSYLVLHYTKYPPPSLHCFSPAQVISRQGELLHQEKASLMLKDSRACEIVQTRTFIKWLHRVLPFDSLDWNHQPFSCKSPCIVCKCQGYYHTIETKMDI